MSILYYLKKSPHIILYVDLRLHLDPYVKTTRVIRCLKGSSEGLSVVCIHAFNKKSCRCIACMSGLTPRQNCGMILNEVSLSVVVI